MFATPHPPIIQCTNQSKHSHQFEELKPNSYKHESSHSKSRETKRLSSPISMNAQPAIIKHTKQQHVIPNFIQL
jgi:hypothetical protein